MKRKVNLADRCYRRVKNILYFTDFKIINPLVPVE